MKIISQIVLYFFICSTIKSQALIKGQIIDSNHANANLYEPINGFCNNRRILKPEYKVTINGDGSFAKTIKINFPTFIVLQIGYQPIFLFVEPKDTISVLVNMSNYSKETLNEKLKIYGNNCYGNFLINSFNFNPGEKFGTFENMLDSLEFRKKMEISRVDYVLGKIFTPFEKLKKMGKITPAFYNTVNNDIKGALVGELTSYLLGRKLTKVQLDQNLAFITAVYKKYPVIEATLKPGIFNSTTIFDFSNYALRKKHPNRELTDSIIYVNEKKVTVPKDFVQWLYVPKKLAQVFWVESLINVQKIFPNETGKRDKEAYLAFFPNSDMKEYLQPPYFNDTDTKLTSVDSSYYVFLNADTINSFKSIISNFKGQNVFIDFWASWCAPCRMEFSDYNTIVDSFCNANNIKRVFLAFEKNQNIESVKKLAYSYKLKGMHAIPNELFTENVLTLFYNGANTYNLPHSVLVDKNGEIVNYDTPRLSATSELFSAMKKSLHL